MLGKFASSVMVLYIFYILCRFGVFKAKLVEGRDGKTTWELKSLSLKSQLEEVNPSEENDCESGAQLRANVETDRGVWKVQEVKKRCKWKERLVSQRMRCACSNLIHRQYFIMKFIEWTSYYSVWDQSVPVQSAIQELATVESKIEWWTTNWTLISRLKLIQRTRTHTNKQNIHWFF